MEETKQTLKTSKIKDNRKLTFTIVGMGLLTAIVVVLQLLAANIKFGPFSITLCLAPIAVGAALYGWKGGAWLGFAFSMVVMFTDTALFFAINPIGTIVTVILKGTLAGLVAGLIFKPLSKKGDVLAVIVCCIVVPIVNKAIFLLGCAVFFMGTISEWAVGAGFDNVGVYMFFGLTGLNFPIELGVNFVLSSAIVSIVQISRRMLKSSAA